MPSAINAANPIEGSPTTLSVRTNFSAAKSEIEALQVDVAGLVAGTVPDASEGAKGIVEIATAGEVTTGTDPLRVITPARLTAWVGSTNVTTVGTINTGTWNGTTIATGKLPAASTAAAGIVELADTDETNAGASTALAVTPAGLAGYTLFAPKASPTFTGTATFSGATITSLGTVTTADINGGTIDGATIGAASHNTGKFTTLQATGLATFDAGIKEATNTLSQTGGGANLTLAASNGTIQSLTLATASVTTTTDSLTDGESITLHIFDGSGFTITWPTMKWVGSTTAPTLDTSYETIVQLWKVNTQLYGALVGVLKS